ncbi:MAG TPA: alpha/beta hydrolase [archaeon]|nr:alpha/beta hydrolase [archaeon]
MISYWLHGWATDSLIFKSVIDSLPSRLKAGVIALDLPGFGSASPLEDEETCFSRIISRLSRDNSKAGIGLVGWSMGAMVALETAAGLGQRAAAVVLISACARFARGENNPYGKDRRILKLMSRRLSAAPQEVLEDFFHGMFSPGSSMRWANFKRDCLPRYRNQNREMLTQGLDYLLRADLRPCLGRVSAPVLLIHGENDPVIDYRLAEELAGALPNARLVKIEAGDHIPFWEAEERFAFLIGKFLEENAL